MDFKKNFKQIKIKRDYPGGFGVRSSAGFTLVEMLVTMGIFSVIIGSLFSVLISQNNFVAQCIGKWDVSRKAGKVMNILVKELRMSTSLYVSVYTLPIDQAGSIRTATGTSIEFQLPVDWDHDDDYVDEFNRMEWGAEDMLGWTIEYCWDSVQEQVLRRVWDSTHTLISQVLVTDCVTLFQVQGLTYSTSLNKYLPDEDMEMAQVRIQCIQRTSNGRVLAVPLTFELKNTISFRN